MLMVCIEKVQKKTPWSFPTLIFNVFHNKTMLVYILDFYNILRHLFRPKTVLLTARLVSKNIVDRSIAPSLEPILKRMNQG